ncbi:hypothetical protein ASE61_18075 [Bosea sp. Root670]|uniref:ABC transporter substrate-binding protein n=1 Tax=Bosea sp. Root670 TaxID=1736583 RepID=UPI0007147809|nr:extracellular solute-binding protein [Bosea sp. Root670]KRE01387.1 hypothetical protein ASE61_18075 [Bosea sp. Root670]
MIKNTTFDRISRRNFIAGASAGAVAVPFAGQSFAQSGGSVTVGTWGGDYGRLLRENVDPIMADKAVRVVQDVGDSDTRMAKTIAQRILPRGAVDVQCFDNVKAQALRNADALLPIDPAKLPSWNAIRPEARDPYIVPHIVSAQVIIYDPEQVDEPPTDLDALLNPKYKGKVGAIIANYYAFLMAGALYRGGSLDDYEAGKSYLKDVNANGLRLYAQPEAFTQAFKSKEIAIAVIWQARSIMWQNAGVRIESAWPKSGAMLYVSGLVIPKNAQNKDAAYAYIEAALQPKAQQGFAENMGYMPSIANANLPPNLAKRLELPPDAPKLVSPDLDKLARELPAMSDWWKKNIEYKG